MQINKTADNIALPKAGLDIGPINSGNSAFQLQCRLQSNLPV